MSPGITMIPRFVALGVAVVLVGCSSGKSDPVDPDIDRDAGVDGGSVPSVSAVIGPEGGTLETESGSARLVVPPGALTVPTELSIAENAAGDPDLDGALFDLGPDGTTFAVAAILAITRDAAPVDGTRTVIVQREASADAWTELPGSVFGDGEVLAPVAHFSQFGLQQQSGQQPTQITNVSVVPADFADDQPVESWWTRWDAHTFVVSVRGSALPDGEGSWRSRQTGATGTFAIVGGTFSFEYDVRNGQFPEVLSAAGAPHWPEIRCGGDCALAAADAGPLPDAGPVPDAGSEGGSVPAAATGPAPDGPAPLWSTGVGEPTGSYSSGVAVDGFGNVVMVGALGASASLGGPVLTTAGSIDLFVAKYGTDGKHTWSKALGGAGDDVATDVAIDDAGDIVVAGEYGPGFDFEGTALGPSIDGTHLFVAKLGPGGNVIWVESFGLAGGYGTQAIRGLATRGGAIFLTGFYNQPLDFGGTVLPAPTGASEAMFVVKLDRDGNHVWSHGYAPESAGSARSFSLGVDSAGDVVVVGEHTGAISLGGTVLTDSGSADGYDGFLAKYSGTDGAHAWSVQLPQDNGIGSVGIDSADDLVVVGGRNELMVAKHSGADGRQLFHRSFTGGADASFGTVALTASDEIVASGWHQATVNLGDGTRDVVGTRDVLVAKLDADARRVVWGKSWGVSGQRMGAGPLFADGAGNVVVSGYYSGGFDFGNGALDASGRIFLLKMPP